MVSYVGPIRKGSPCHVRLRLPKLSASNGRYRLPMQTVAYAGHQALCRPEQSLEVQPGIGYRTLAGKSP